MSNRHSGTARLHWLNTLVAFEAAARHKSLKLAAGELHLTPGAVSRQVKLLEESLGVTLFIRTHNAIELTELGKTFLDHVNSALATLRKGAKEVSGQGAKLTIRAPMTLMQRWLIPRIEKFRLANPGIDLRFQTAGVASSERTDVEIRYVRGAPRHDETTGEAFLIDHTAPVCSPALLAGKPAAVTPGDLLSLPLLLDTADGWSWQQWCKSARIPFQPGNETIAFDIDEAAIDACFSGLGVAQANTAFVADFLASGRLIHLCPQIRATLGAYHALIRIPGRIPDAFVNWLRTEGQAQG